MSDGYLWEEVRSLEDDLRIERLAVNQFRKIINAKDGQINRMGLEHNQRIQQIARLEKHIDALEEELAEAATRTRV